VVVLVMLVMVILLMLLLLLQVVVLLLLLPVLLLLHLVPALLLWLVQMLGLALVVLMVAVVAAVAVVAVLESGGLTLACSESCAGAFSLGRCLRCPLKRGRGGRSRGVSQTRRRETEARWGAGRRAGVSCGPRGHAVA